MPWFWRKPDLFSSRVFLLVCASYGSFPMAPITSIIPISNLHSHSLFCNNQQAFSRFQKIVENAVWRANSHCRCLIVTGYQNIRLGTLCLCIRSLCTKRSFLAIAGRLSSAATDKHWFQIKCHADYVKTVGLTKWVQLLPLLQKSSWNDIVHLPHDWAHVFVKRRKEPRASLYGFKIFLRTSSWFFLGKRSCLRLLDPVYSKALFAHHNINDAEVIIVRCDSTRNVLMI